MRHLGVQNRRGLPCLDALPAELGRPDRQKSVSEPASERIHNMHESRAEFFHELTCRYARRVVGSADPGAHGNIDDIQPIGQNRRKMRKKQLRIQQRRPDHVSFSQAVIIGVPVKVIDISLIHLRLPVHGIITGKERNSFQHTSRQVGAAVRENNKRHIKYPPD